METFGINDNTSDLSKFDVLNFSLWDHSLFVETQVIYTNIKFEISGKRNDSKKYKDLYTMNLRIIFIRCSTSILDVKDLSCKCGGVDIDFDPVLSLN